MNNGLLEDMSVKELFIAVDELVSLHQVFAQNMEERLSRWSRSQMIGDLLLDMVREGRGKGKEGGREGRGTEEGGRGGKGERGGRRAEDG